MNEMPVISVIIVNYQHRRWLSACLATVLACTLPIEVIVVDNSPEDGTTLWLNQEYPMVRVIADGDNDGYAGGNNRGMEMARAPYWCVLNPDTQVRPGALEELYQVALHAPDCLVTAKLLTPNGHINACGNLMHFTGITACLGLGEPPDRYTGVFPVPLVSGAVIMAAQPLWEALGGFDAHYFLYLEDADLSLRAQVLGYHIVCAGNAEVIHEYNLKMTAQKFYYLERNRLMTVLTLYQTATLRRLLPGLALAEAATWSYGLLHGLGYMQAKIRGYRWLWQNRQVLMIRRRRIQGRRRVADGDLLSRMVTALPYGQLMGSHRVARVLERCTTPIFRWLLAKVQAS